jgi:hypothetical protein
VPTLDLRPCATILARSWGFTSLLPWDSRGVHGQLAGGANSRMSVMGKSLRLSVTTTAPWARAVPAISASGVWIVRPLRAQSAWYRPARVAASRVVSKKASRSNKALVALRSEDRNPRSISATVTQLVPRTWPSASQPSNASVTAESPRRWATRTVVSSR